MNKDDLELIDIISVLSEAKLQVIGVELLKLKKYEEVRLVLILIKEMKRLKEIVERNKKEN